MQTNILQIDLVSFMSLDLIYSVWRKTDCQRSSSENPDALTTFRGIDYMSSIPKRNNRSYYTLCEFTERFKIYTN